jgi:cold shock CspA family protein
MGRSHESFHKKEVQKRTEKKRKDKEKKKNERRETGRSGLDDMIAYVDELGMIVDTPPEEAPESPDASEIEVSIPKKDPSEQGARVREGRVSFLNHSKGYGFITESGTGQSVFVHVNDFLDDINESDRVSFEMGKGQKGPMALNVKLQQ